VAQPGIITSSPGRQPLYTWFSDFEEKITTRGLPTLGFVLGDKPHLCEFAVTDFQPEFKTETMWYGSMGSGQPIRLLTS
jgi:hypothetical protein